MRINSHHIRNYFNRYKLFVKNSKNLFFNSTIFIYNVRIIKYVDDNSEWVESKAKEGISQNFIKTVLELSGYKVMNFGIENHNQEIIKQVKTNYHADTNRKLLSMPDFVVVDNETKEAWLIEVKYRSFKRYFNMKKSNISFGYGDLKSYLEFWRDAILILVFNVTPFCLCVDFNKINWNIHFKGKFENNKGGFDELWNFSGIYQTINDRFPKVTHENFKRTLSILGIKNNEDKSSKHYHLK